MLKRIETGQVRLGMFIHAMEGSWLAHPFWRRKFLLDDPQQLAELRASDVPGVIIDTSKGHDVQAAPVADHAPAPPTAAGAAARPSNVTPIRRAPGERPMFGRAPVSAAALRQAQQSATGGRAEAQAAARQVITKSKRTLHRVFEQSRLGKAVKLSALEPMIDDITNSIHSNPHAFTGMARIKKDNEYLYMHALAVSALMINLARELDLTPEQTRDAGMAGLLMDIGMGHMPQDLLFKDGALSDMEFRIIRTHTTMAHEFLSIGGDLPDEVMDACLHHHERLDGSGYPHGLAGDQIGLFARMVAICDVYDAMTSNRLHQQGLDPADVLARMSAWDGQFDATIFEAFVRSLGIYPIGSLVRLRSDRLALVVDQCRDDYTLPTVRAFYSVIDRHATTPETIDLANCFGADQIVGSEHPEDWDLGDWSQLSQRLMTERKAAA